MRGRPFQPGQSGNPAGRPKGFGARIRELTGDGEELVQLALSIARAKRPAIERTATGEVYEVPASTAKERMEAVKWLADRGWGKAPEQGTPLGEAEGGETEAPMSQAEANAIMEASLRHGAPKSH